MAPLWTSVIRPKLTAMPSATCRTEAQIVWDCHQGFVLSSMLVSLVEDTPIFGEHVGLRS